MRGSKTMNDLTAFQRDLLRVIGGMDEPIGLDIKEEIEDYYEADVNHGRLYPNLDTLVSRGFLNKSEKDGRSNKYEITSDGISLLQERDAFNQRRFPEATPKNLKSEA